MRDLDDSLLEQLPKNSVHYFAKVELKRRQEDGTLDSAINLDNYIISIDPINWKLDTENLNEWKVSNLNIVVDNSDNIWDREYTNSIWNRTGSDYVPYKSEIKIIIGAYIDKGVYNYPGFEPSEVGDSKDNYLYVFDGIIENIIYRPNSDEASIQVKGKESVLKNLSAEEASNVVSNEELYAKYESGEATSDPSNDTNGYFYDSSKSWTADEWSGYILRIISGDGAGNEYDIDGNTATRLECTGDNLYSDGIRDGDTYRIIKYGTDGTVKTFATAKRGVGRIDEVRINTTAKERGVEYSISNLSDYDNPAEVEFEVAPTSGDNVYADYIYWYRDKKIEELVEYLLDHAGITDYEIDPVIFEGAIEYHTEDECSEWTGGDYENIECDSDKLRLADFNSYTDITDSTEYTADDSPTENFDNNGTMEEFQAVTRIKAEFKGFHMSGHTAYLEVLDGSSVVWSKKINFWTSYVTEYRDIDLSLYFSEGETYTVRRRLPDGCRTKNLEVFHPAGDYAKSGAYNSNSIDCESGGGTVTDFNIVTYSADLKTEGEIVIFTSSSPDNSTWESWTVLGSGGQIQSTTDRYLKYRVALGGNQSETPELDSITLSWTKTSVSIELADFTGLTCWDALVELAKISGYQFGFDGLGEFFFIQRSKSGAPVFRFQDSVSIAELLDYDLGLGRLYNLIKAEFGEFTEIISPNTEGESSPNSIDKYGERELTISGGNLLTSDNVNIANSICIRYYELFKNPRISFRTRGPMLPMLELNDVVRVPYNDQDGEEIWIKSFRITGIRIDPTRWETEFNLLSIED